MTLLRLPEQPAQSLAVPDRPGWRRRVRPADPDDVAVVLVQVSGAPAIVMAAPIAGRRCERGGVPDGDRIG